MGIWNSYIVHLWQKYARQNSVLSVKWLDIAQNNGKQHNANGTLEAGIHAMKCNYTYYDYKIKFLIGASKNIFRRNAHTEDFMLILFYLFAEMTKYTFL